MYDLSQAEEEQVIESYNKWNKKRGGGLSFDEFIYWLGEII